MGSDGNNKMKSGGAGFPPPPSHTTDLCANVNCGFSGAAATMGLCSRCYLNLRMMEVRKGAALVVLHPRAQPDSLSPPCAAAAATPTPSNMCHACKKKVRVMGFNCKCGGTFCGTHRYPEEHNCTFDYKGQGRDQIAKANPIIKAHKLERI